MTTTIEDNQLSEELQELYIISKHWMDELDFFEQDLNFLERLFAKTYTRVPHHPDFDNVSEVLESIVSLEGGRAEIKTKIANYLHLLEPLINKSEEAYHLSLIETHAVLEREMGALLKTFKSVKARVFKFSSEDLKSMKAQLQR